MNEPMHMGRRSFLAGGSTSLLLAGCCPCPDFESVSLPPGAIDAADAHVHLFNGADLPVVGFAKYVLAARFPNLSPAILAIANVLLTALKFSSLSANAERRLRVPPWGRGDRVSPAEFADALADRIERVVRTTDPELLLRADMLVLVPDQVLPGQASSCTGEDCSDEDCESDLAGERYDRAAEAEEPDDDTRLSYFLLAALLAEGSALERSGVGPSQALELGDAGTRAGAERLLRSVVPVDRALLETLISGEPGSIETMARSLRGAALPPFVESRLGAARSGDWRAAFAYDLGTVLRWAWRMRQTRCAHLAAYLDFVERQAPVRVGDCINLLVDYDEWLGDRPAAGSSHADQIRFWTAIAEMARERIRIHTFAGYDPLKHCYDRLSSGDGRSAYFDELVGFYRAGRAGDGSAAVAAIAGLKLYPVMGFNPAGGNRLPSCRQAGRRVRRKWRSVHPNRDFGEQLDETLDLFFAAVADHDIPLLAHGRKSLQAVEGGNELVSVANWRRRAEAHWRRHRKPLRICLGHFTGLQTDKAELGALMRMNRQPVPEARAYIDLSYGFAHGFDVTPACPSDDLAACYLDELKLFAEEHDRECRFILFGTDWIMLGMERDADEYVARAHRLMSADSFWNAEGRLERIFRTNFLDFMKLSSPV